MKKKFIIYISLLYLAIPETWSVEQWRPNEMELRLLPPFCRARFNGGPEAEAWKSKIGKGFLHLHHFCAGLNFINRYYKSKSPQEKTFNLNNAMGNFNYMIDHYEPGFPLQWKVYLNRGKVFSIRKEYIKALNDYRKAAKLRPKSISVHIALSDTYMKLGNNDQALKIVKHGLQYHPSNKHLLRLYKRISNKDYSNIIDHE